MRTVARIDPARDAERLLGVEEDVVPEAGLGAALELRAGRSTGRIRVARSSAALWKK